MEPNIPAIVITNAFAVVLLVGLLFISYMTRERHHIDDRIFSALIFVCIGSCVFEPLTFIADGKAEPWAFILNYTGNTYCYIANACFSYLWVLYVDLRLHKDTTDEIRRHFPALFIPVGIWCLLVLANIFGGYFFVIDANNVYARQPLSYIGYVIAFVCLFYSLYLKHSFEKNQGLKRKFFPVWLFILPVFIGAGLQAAFFGLSLAWPATAVGLALIHMSLQNELSYLDSLTGLYNRTYLDYALQSMERSKRTDSGGIMIDLDFFKVINDTYGHSVGDEALKEVARILRSCEPDNAQVIRFAGDEFIILMSDADEETAVAVEQSITAAIEEFNETADAPYELSVSMGHDMFVSGEDSSDEFLRRIDGRMYAQKREHHIQAEVPEDIR